MQDYLTQTPLSAYPGQTGTSAFNQKAYELVTCESCTGWLAWQNACHRFAGKLCSGLKGGIVSYSKSKFNTTAS